MAKIHALRSSPVVLTSAPPATNTAATEEPRHRAAARHLWAMLLARIYEAFPLACPICHAKMRIITFMALGHPVNDVGTVRKFLDHIGESTQPPRIAPARGPPLWEGAAASQQAPDDPRWDSSAQPAPQIEFDQRITW